MASYQKTLIVGNVGRDAVLRYTPSGKAVADFSVACTEKWTGADGQKQEKVTWYKVTVWGTQAETANKYVKKGMQILVEGSISASAYTDKSGKPAASLELTGRVMQFLGSRSDSNHGDAAADQGGDAYTEADKFDDIPF